MEIASEWHQLQARVAAHFKAYAFSMVAKLYAFKFEFATRLESQNKAQTADSSNFDHRWSGVYAV